MVTTTKRKTRRPSTITLLPEPLQEEVNRLIRSGWTIDRIRAELAQLGAEVSRSAVGRYVKSARESMETYRQGQEVAKVWLDKLEAEPEGDVARLLPEMLRAIAFSTMAQMGQQPGDGEAPKAIKPMDVMLLAKAIEHLSKAGKDAFVIDRARAEARAAAERELKARQAEQLSAVSKARGVSDDTQQAIREALGITA